MKKLISALLLVSLIMVFSVSAFAGNEPARASARTDSIVVGTTDMNGIWSTLYANSMFDNYACELMFDSFISSTPDGKPVSQACNYSVSLSGKTYTFTLKDNVKFWDGKAATADDLAFVFYILADPSFDGVADLSPCNIVGYDAYKNDKTGAVKTISGIKVINKKSISITLSKPFAPALWYLNLPVMKKSYYGAGFKKGNTGSVKKLLAKPMGTGQYKFVSYDPTKGLQMSANKSYFLGAPKISKVQFVVVPQGKELDSVISGDVDVENATCSAENVNKAKESGYITPVNFPTNGYGVIHWNTNDPLLSDEKVRQALAYGLDRETVVNKVYGQYGKVNNVPVPMGSWGYTTAGITDYKFSTIKARQLLDQAGWKIDPNTNKLMKNGKQFVINFTVTPGNSVTDVMLPVMKDNYAKLGIDVNIESADFATMLKALEEGKIQACFMGAALTTPDPDQYTSFYSTSTQNYFKYKNSTLDKLLNQELTQTNVKERTATFGEINKLLNKELPVFPVYQRNDLWIINSRITNVPKLGAYRDLFLDFYKYTIKK